MDMRDRRTIPVITVHQWLSEWDDVPWNDDEMRGEPPEYFLLFALSAYNLRRLSGIRRRSVASGLPRREDIGIQRRHDKRRSAEIRDYIRHGYPWANLSRAKRESGRFDHFKKPGWLPTAIVVNIRTDGAQPDGRFLPADDALVLSAEEEREVREIALPRGLDSADWSPEVAPIEVIDGQHRLWAFEGSESVRDFELPVVAFVDLDVSWQAYLFWSINVSPKRISPSLAYDLYPLLRTEEWLNQTEDHIVYRKARAQEITELLWLHGDSPWQDRINMLGETPTEFGVPAVTQSSWVASLAATYLKKTSGRGIRIGGLFGAPLTSQPGSELGWSRPQQAAFIILLWRTMADAVTATEAGWATSLREEPGHGGVDEEADPAFAGEHSLLCTDAGVRGFLDVTNSIFFVASESIDFEATFDAYSESDTDLPDDTETAVAEVTAAIDALSAHEIERLMAELAAALADYDWRTYSAASLSSDPDEKNRKRAFRGSGGYAAMREELLRHLQEKQGSYAPFVSEVIERLGGV